MCNFIYYIIFSNIYLGWRRSRFLRFQFWKIKYSDDVTHESQQIVSSYLCLSCTLMTSQGCKKSQ